jgi:HSP20 family protein
MAQSTLTPTTRKESAKEIARTDPFEGMGAFGWPFGRLFQDFWGRRWPEENDRLIAPLTDITEEDSSFTVSAELPGLKKDDIKIQFENGVLAISGEKEASSESRDKSYHRMERRYGSFYRAMTLPSGADFGGATADYTDGVLNIRIPKREDAKPKTLRIK